MEVDFTVRFINQKALQHCNIHKTDSFVQFRVSGQIFFCFDLLFNCVLFDNNNYLFEPHLNLFRNKPETVVSLLLLGVHVMKSFLMLSVRSY